MQKIIVGDDRLDFAKQSMPYIPDAEITYVSDPNELIDKATEGGFDIIITDLEYTEGGLQGLGVLAALKDRGIKGRKILWTGRAGDELIRKQAERLDAEILDKDELPALVGMTVSKAPLKKGGIVLVYSSEGASKPVTRAFQQTIPMFFKDGDIVVSSDLKQELSTGKYGLVIDTSTLCWDRKQTRSSGVVAHDMKYIKLAEVPRVVCVYDITSVVEDILKLAREFLSQR